jgi:hypothetical protein
MLALATIFGVLLFALGITGPSEAAILAGCILLGATMISVQIARLTASIEKSRERSEI